MPSRCSRRRRLQRCTIRIGTSGRPDMAAHKPPAAMRRSAPTTPPAASTVRPSGPTISISSIRLRLAPPAAARTAEQCAAIRSVPGRRLCPSHPGSGLRQRRARLRLAGHQHQPHRDHRRRRSAPRRIQRQCLFGQARGRLSFCGAWVGGAGITPYAAGQFTTFDCSAYAEQVIAGTPALRWPMPPRA